MRNYDCASCPFSRWHRASTKPRLVCTRGRYLTDTQGEGYPVSWIKKCEYDEEIKKEKPRN